MTGPAGAAVLSLLSGLPSATRGRRLLFVLQAFIDDSGNNAESPVMVLAGFVGRAEDWAKFSDRWVEILSAQDIDTFKMNHCHFWLGEFKGLSADERDCMLLELTELIRQTVIASSFAIVNRTEYFNFLARHASPKVTKSPYFLLYHSVISATLHSMRAAGMDERVEFIFDEQMHQSDAVQAKFSEMMRVMEPTLAVRLGGRPIHRSDKDFIPLQAADLFAWHIRRWYHEDAAGRTFTSEALSLLRRIPFWGMVHDSESLAAIGDVANEMRMLRQLRERFSSSRFRAEMLKALRNTPSDD